jgi:hypothetical protein
MRHVAEPHTIIARFAGFAQARPLGEHLLEQP